MHLDDAIRLAVLAHAGQTDKKGEPYILHPLRVMLACRPEDRVVAVLHDVMEDSDNLAAIALAELPRPEFDAILALTRRKAEGETYEAYIERVRQNPQALRVKRADLADNLGRNPPGDLRERYERALEAIGRIGA